MPQADKSSVNRILQIFNQLNFKRWRAPGGGGAIAPPSRIKVSHNCDPPNSIFSATFFLSKVALKRHLQPLCRRAIKISKLFQTDLNSIVFFHFGIAYAFMYREHTEEGKQNERQQTGKKKRRRSEGRFRRTETQRASRRRARTRLRRWNPGHWLRISRNPGRLCLPPMRTPGIP